ncbi:MAG: GspH/FimT family pseudopilin [Gammaproteobacteria bacterium]|nr:GspH/FimT family pseudopilin [Gammaproteobacteria bacterium]
MSVRLRAGRGFTVIELMVTLAIAGVLIGLAVPAFSGFVSQRSFTTQVNDFVIAVTLARSEATLRRQVVSVQAIDVSDANNEWGPGWCVTVGNPGDCATPIRTFDNLGTNTMNAPAPLAAGTLSFDQRGLLTLGVPGTLDLCNAAEDPGRRISVSAIGRTTSQELTCN